MSADEGCREFETRDVACIIGMIEALENASGYETLGDPIWDDDDAMQFVVVQKPGVDSQRPDFQALANNLAQLYQGKVSIAVLELTELAEGSTQVLNGKV